MDRNSSNDCAAALQDLILCRPSVEVPTELLPVARQVLNDYLRGPLLSFVRARLIVG